MAPRLTISSSAVERREKDWEKTKLSFNWLFSGITGARWLPPFLLPKVNRICITPNYHLCLPHPNPLNPHTDQALFDLHRSSCSCETEAQAFSFHILFLKSAFHFFHIKPSCPQAYQCSICCWKLGRKKGKWTPAEMKQEELVFQHNCMWLKMEVIPSQHFPRGKSSPFKDLYM